MGFIAGTFGNAIQQWTENPSQVAGQQQTFGQNGNGTENGLTAGTLGGLLDAVTFSATGTAATYLSPASINLREMQGSSSQPATITIANSGGLSGTFTLTNAGGNALTFGTSSGTLALIERHHVESRLG